MRALDALELDRMGAELVEQPQVRTFGDVVVVHRPQHRAEAVWIEHIPFAAGIASVKAHRLQLLDGCLQMNPLLLVQMIGRFVY